MVNWSRYLESLCNAYTQWWKFLLLMDGLNELPDDEAWLEDLFKHHLIQVTSNYQIEFCHQLIQEYYAAGRNFAGKAFAGTLSSER